MLHPPTLDQPVLCTMPQLVYTEALHVAEVGQAKASEKDIGLAWERIETFLWRHVGPSASAQSGGQMSYNQHNGQTQDNDLASSSLTHDSNLADSSEIPVTNRIATA